MVKQRHFEGYFAEIRREKSSVSFVDRQRRKCSFFSSVLHCMYSQSVVGFWQVLFRYSGNPVMLAQGILYCGVGFDIVWPQFLALAAIGGTFFGIAHARFRSTIDTMA